MTVDPLLDLKGRRVLVTGAAGGIGGATANPPEIPPEAEIVQLDCSDRQAVEALVQASGPFTDLVDAAAIYGGDDWTDPDWDAAFERVIACNIRGPLNLCRAVLPGMQQAGGGRIVLVGSVAGHMGGIRSGPGYAFTKGGVHAFMKWLALRSLPDGILVNAIAPGPVETGMVTGKGYDPAQMPLGRMAKPEEIAAMALFLLGPGIGYATGAVFDITGGTYIR